VRDFFDARQRTADAGLVHAVRVTGAILAVFLPLPVRGQRLDHPVKMRGIHAHQTSELPLAQKPRTAKIYHVERNSIALSTLNHPIQLPGIPLSRIDFRNKSIEGMTYSLDLRRRVLSFIRQKIKPDSVYTDGHTGYNALDVSEFNHFRIVPRQHNLDR